MPTTTTIDRTLSDISNTTGIMTTMQRISFRADHHAATKRGGFSLIELMVVVVVIAILAAIAIPIYQKQIQESRRTSAKTGLLDVASREERYYSTNNQYADSFTELGYPAATGSALVVPNSDPGYYRITLSVPAASGSTFTATATPASTQIGDVCGSYSISYLGVQGNNGGAAQNGCW
jgi:type IV pilus assembly protein PilE